MSTLFADVSLAIRLENIEVFAAESCACELKRQRPDADIAVEEVAGGRAVFAGVGSPLTEAKGIGMHGPVNDADLGRMEAVFFGRKVPSQVVVSPLADPSLIEGLGRRGYRLARFENILALPLAAGDPEPAVTPGIDVRRVAAAESTRYAHVVAPNFVGPGESADELVEMVGTMHEMEHAPAFLAYIEGEPVGGGAVIVHCGVALLAGAATSPAYRNRGVHAALHGARLAFARRQGCDLAAQGADPGSTSQRNAERRGFRVAYTRAVLIRNPP